MSRTTHRRNNKGLYLPLARPDAEKIILRCRLALESVRNGYPNETGVDLMLSTVLLTRYLTEDGYGLLSLDLLQAVEATLLDAMMEHEKTGKWSISHQLIEQLISTVNEYDRQLRETRLHAVIAASQRLDSDIERLKATQ